MRERLALAETALAQWRALPPGGREEALRLLDRIAEEPIAGAPLLEPLRGLWSLRGESVRVVYRVTPEARAIGIVFLGPVREVFA